MSIISSPSGPLSSPASLISGTSFVTISQNTISSNSQQNTVPSSNSQQNSVPSNSQQVSNNPTLQTTVGNTKLSNSQQNTVPSNSQQVSNSISNQPPIQTFTPVDNITCVNTINTGGPKIQRLQITVKNGKVIKVVGGPATPDVIKKIRTRASQIVKPIAKFVIKITSNVNQVQEFNCEKQTCNVKIVKEYIYRPKTKLYSLVRTRRIAPGFASVSPKAKGVISVEDISTTGQKVVRKFRPKYQRTVEEFICSRDVRIKRV